MSKKIKIALGILIVCGVVFCICLSSAAAFVKRACAGEKIIEGVKCCGVTLSGKTKDEAVKLLREIQPAPDSFTVGVELNDVK